MTNVAWAEVWREANGWTDKQLGAALERLGDGGREKLARLQSAYYQYREGARALDVQEAAHEFAYIEDRAWPPTEQEPNAWRRSDITRASDTA